MAQEVENLLRKYVERSKPGCYCRVKIGKVRKQSEIVARIDLEGANPALAAAEVQDAIAGNPGNSGDKVFIDVLEIGGQTVIGSLTITPPEVLDSDGNPVGGPPDALAGSDALLGYAINAIVGTNGQLASQLNLERNRNMDLTLRLIDTAGRAVSSETLLTWIQEHGMPGSEDDAMGRALEQFSPILSAALPTIIAKMSAKKGEPETPGQTADRLLLEAVAIPSEVWFEAGRKEKVEAFIAGLLGAQEVES